MTKTPVCLINKLKFDRAKKLSSSAQYGAARAQNIIYTEIQAHLLNLSQVCKFDALLSLIY